MSANYEKNILECKNMLDKYNQLEGLIDGFKKTAVSKDQKKQYAYYKSIIKFSYLFKTKADSFNEALLINIRALKPLADKFVEVAKTQLKNNTGKGVYIDTDLLTKICTEVYDSLNTDLKPNQPEQFVFNENALSQYILKNAKPILEYAAPVKLINLKKTLPGGVNPETTDGFKTLKCYTMPVKEATAAK